MTTESIRYQLVIQFPGTYFSSLEEVHAFEDRLIACMPRTCDVDGHDAGSGTVNFFVYTGYPDAAFLAFRKYLGTNPVEKAVRVAFRDVAGEDFTNLWPKRDARPFHYWYE